MARFLHTADLHLGRTLYGERLLDDQAAVLEQLTQIVERESIDAVLIAGDVFDRSVPPADAIDLLDAFLFAVAGERKTPVVMIPGNHDSADRLGFGARLLGDRLHIASTLQRACAPMTVEDEYGPIEIFGLPFLEPARVRAFLDDESIGDHHTATAAMVEQICTKRTTKRSVLVAHAFVQGGSVSESERPLTIGGLDTVEASVFRPFDYVALGHLHRPQAAGYPHVQYAGSPLKYSASEVSHAKAFTQIELDQHGQCTIERIPIEAPRDLVRLEGTLQELLTAEQPARTHDLVIAKLLDKGPVHDAMNQLRGRWPNTLHIERDHSASMNNTPLAGKDHRTMGIDALFELFFESVTGESMSKEEQVCLQDIFRDMNKNKETA